MGLLLNKPSAERHPLLREAWEAYGHSVPWDALEAVRFRSDFGYCLLAWRSAWQFQNDSSDLISARDFARIRFVPECDWHVRPDDGA